MRLSFNQGCHALVAFSLPNFRVKDRAESGFGGRVMWFLPKEMLRQSGKTPNKEMIE
jgi:hypothetical protein